MKLEITVKKPLRRSLLFDETCSAESTGPETGLETLQELTRKKAKKQEEKKNLETHIEKHSEKYRDAEQTVPVRSTTAQSVPRSSCVSSDNWNPKILNYTLYSALLNLLCAVLKTN